MNYPENYDFTRSVEYKYYLDEKSAKTVVSFEYPEAFERAEMSAIIRSGKENQFLYDRYLQEAAKLKNI